MRTKTKQIRNRGYIAASKITMHDDKVFWISEIIFDDGFRGNKISFFGTVAEFLKLDEVAE